MRFFRFFLKVPVLRESLLSPIDFRAFYTILHQKYREIPHAQEQNLDETGIISILWVNMGQLFLSFQVCHSMSPFYFLFSLMNCIETSYC